MDETVNPQGNESPAEPFNPEAAFDDYLTRQASAGGDGDSSAQPATGVESDQPDSVAKPDVATETGADEQRFKVKVNGEEREVPLTELLKGYQLESDYRIKTSQTAEQARAAQAQFAQAQAMQQHYGQQLQQYQARLAQMQPAQPDPNLIETDPVNYLRQQQAWAAWQGQMQQAQNEAQALQAHQAQQHQKFTNQRLSDEAQALVKLIPEFADATKSQATKAEIAQYLTKSGFSAQEVDGVADHRAVVLARKAMLYDQMMGKQAATAQKLVNVPPKAPQRPGVGNQTSATDGRTRAMQSLKRSGSIDDAANAFAAMLSKR
jgi:hypothetical protein